MADAESIFLNYRRDQAEWPTGRLHDRLVEVFGHDRIFTDVDSIPPGQDFTKVLETAVGSCRVLLAVIGQDWTNSLDEAGRRRLENPHDWVRFEIESALRRPGVRVIPILIDGAAMPRAEELPGELAQLSTRQGVKITASAFARDTDALIGWLRDIINPPVTAPSQPAQSAKSAQSPFRSHRAAFQPPRTPPQPHRAPPAQPPPAAEPAPPAKPPIAVPGYQVLPDDLQWSGPLPRSVVVERVAVTPGQWVKIGDPLFEARGINGPVTFWSTFIGQVAVVGYQSGQALQQGRPVLTLGVSGWLYRVNARMPFDTGILFTSGEPARQLGASGQAARLLVMVDNTASRPVPWRSSCLLYVPEGRHAISAVYEQPGMSFAAATAAVMIRRGRRLAVSYEAPRAAGRAGRLRA
ncbi:MAG TPA: toll/interleukin-1 receptor domain-containing protein [Streptosporangiaceae bacterium]|nr:toll/interleukin-1 receptor domain-containing protein [Streptosporangiaceae bacterium]